MLKKRKHERTTKKRSMMMLLLSAIVLCLITFITILFTISPGKLKPFVEQSGKPLNGSISEKIFVQIGGVEQGILIRGKDVNNPVLLFVHGGPLFPEYFLVEKYPGCLADNLKEWYPIKFNPFKKLSVKFSTNLPFRS